MASAAIVTIFDRIAPEYALDTWAQANKAGFIDDAAQEINRSAWGDKADRATAYLAAHMLTMTKRGSTGQGGALIRKKVGPLEKAYAAPSVRSDMPGYETTPYGQEYARMLNTLSVTPMLLG